MGDALALEVSELLVGARCLDNGEQVVALDLTLLSFGRKRTAPARLTAKPVGPFMWRLLGAELGGKA